MTKSLTILFQPLNAVGRVNACIGVAQVLQQSEHRIVFAISEQWREKLSVYGFEEELISDPERNPNQNSPKQTNSMESLIELPLIEKLDFMFNKLFPRFLGNAKNAFITTTEIVNRCKPDVIIIDDFFVCPAVFKMGIPWVFICSANPLLILNDNNLPPPLFGLSLSGNRSEWNDCRLKLTEMSETVHNKYNEWLKEYGLNQIPESSLFYPSPHLNIYQFPKEIDYSNEVSLPSNFYGFDNFMRSDKTEEFVLPEQLKNISGKLIFLTLGSMASANVKLMKRLISILSKSPHKFIVSTGQLHDQYELADNMWGNEYVPQTQVLPLVDLVIFHGGNNTLTETFYFGKPMIVLPLFADQYDNAQRIQDTGYGIRLDAHKCSETELLEAIEKLLNNSDLKLKLEKISQRIQTSNSVDNIVALIEGLVR